jgi:large subunit ribosomal protein L2
MAIKIYRPTSAGRRNMSVSTFEEVTRSKPERTLLAPLRKTAGRNNRGVVTTRHRGGGHKRRYRIIDFRRDKFGVAAKVESIEYDPNRSARIALVDLYRWRAPLYPGVARAACGRHGDVRPYCRHSHRQRPADSQHPARYGRTQRRTIPGRGGQLVRSAGLGAQLLAKEGTMAQIRLPSGEVRYIDMNCLATIGVVSNPDHANIDLGKAGRKRWLGIRPGTRGIAMDPGAHPHGGGEGRSPIGMKAPKTPWGKPALGKKTRVNKRTNKFIVRRGGKA